MPARHAHINLLPHTEFEASMWGKFLKWALSTGRYLIILTEMVVIVAFLSRFKLDKDLADLADSINGKKAVIQAQTQFEQDFRILQSRLNSAGGLLQHQLNAPTVLDQLTSLTPEGVYIINLTLDRSILTLTAKAPQDAFQAFMGLLSSKNSFKNVSLSNIVYDAAEGVKFTLVAAY